MATTICPFHGVLYDDPSAGAGDGVLDLTDVIAPGNGNEITSRGAPSQVRSSEGEKRSRSGAAARLFDARRSSGALHARGVVGRRNRDVIERPFPRPPQQWVPSDNPYNAVHLLEPDGAEHWTRWLNEGVLRRSPSPCLYVYRVGWVDDNGTPTQGSGVIGVIGAEDHDGFGLVPNVVHLENPEFSELLAPTGTPLARAGGPDGRHYRMWAITQAGVVRTIQDAVAASPLADGVSGLIAVTADFAVPPIGLVFSGT